MEQEKKKNKAMRNEMDKAKGRIGRELVNDSLQRKRGNNEGDPENDEQGSERKKTKQSSRTEDDK